MIIPNGQRIESDPLDPDTDGDGLSDGEEMGELITFGLDGLAIAIISALPSAIFDYFTDGELNVHFKCFDYKSDPTSVDSDGDDIVDEDDIYPLTAYKFEKTYFWDSVSYNVNTNEWNIAPSFINVFDNEVGGILDRFYSNIAIENSVDFGYIYDQDKAPMSDIKYGTIYSMNDNGCELIAIYNALKLKNNYQSLSEIALEFEINNGMVMDTKLLSTHPSYSRIPTTSVGIDFPSGYFGTNPFEIRRYFNFHKYKNEQTTSLSELQSWVKPGRVFIFSCWNNEDDISKGLHTFVVSIDSSGKLHTYNGYDDGYTYNSFSEIINRKGSAFITGYYMC